MNHFIVSAKIIERETLRYTPAGIPLIKARLQHVSEQKEAQTPRLVGFEIPAVAAGDISTRVSQADMNKLFQFSGFLSRKSLNSKNLIFHIINFEIILAE